MQSSYFLKAKTMGFNDLSGSNDTEKTYKLSVSRNLEHPQNNNVKTVWISWLNIITGLTIFSQIGQMYYIYAKKICKNYMYKLFTMLPKDYFCSWRNINEQRIL